METGMWVEEELGLEKLPKVMGAVYPPEHSVVKAVVALSEQPSPQSVRTRTS